MISLSITIFTYLFLFAFWSDLVLNIKISNVVGLSFVNITFYLSLILWCLIAVKRKKILQWNEIYKYLLLMLFIAVISILIKILNPEIRRVKILQEIVNIKNWSEGFIVFVIFYNLFDKREYCIRAIWALMIFFMFCNSVMLIDWFDIIDIPGIQTRSYGESSGFGNPNDYAAFMILFLFVFLSSFIFSENYLQKYSYLSCLIISFISFIMTGSRGAFLSFSLAIIIYFFLINRLFLRTLKLKYIMIFIFVLIISILILPENFTKDFKNKVVFDGTADINDYSHGRETIWKEGINIFFDSPVYGHGFNAFSILLEKRTGKGAVAHNRYLQYLVDFGLIGLFSYFLIHISLLIQSFKRLNKTLVTSHKIIFVNYFVGLIGYSFAVIFVNALNSSLIFWLYSSAVIRLSQFDKYTNKNR